jgi:hypothetical protein
VPFSSQKKKASLHRLFDAIFKQMLKDTPRQLSVEGNRKIGQHHQLATASSRSSSTIGDDFRKSLGRRLGIEAALSLLKAMLLLMSLVRDSSSS